MIYFKHTLGGLRIDFTHPYMTISQMKQMIIRNYEKPRDYYLCGYSSKEMIAELEKQARPFIKKESSLRMPVLVFPIPTREMWKPVQYGFILKFEATGETIIYSPVRLWEDNDYRSITEVEL